MDLLTKNLQYLLNNKIITANKLLEITNHNSTGLVAMWKSGERTMKTEDIVKLANYLNLTIDDLINRDLSIKKDDTSEFEVLFNKYKMLTDNDRELIKNIIDTRKEQIDKQNEGL